MSIPTILLAVLGISILVIVHEGGHYLAARAFGMRVLRFSVGFGPALFRYQPKGSPTVFQICAIPLLAYVQIAGMNPSEEIDPKDPELYPNKGVFARIVTIFAGPFANYLAASLLVFGVALSGWPNAKPSQPMVVATVQPGSPAARAHLRPGDTILRANARNIRDVADLQKVTRSRSGQATEYVVDRNGREITLRITPQRSQDGRGIIGVTARTITEYVPQPIGEAARMAIVTPFQQTVLQLAGMVELAKRRTTEGITGPVGMGKIVAEQAAKGPVEYLLIIMLLSVALGLFNLLPFPALDGGRLMFLGYEVITRRRPNERFEAVVHTVGLLFLLGVLVLVTFRDIVG